VTTTTSRVVDDTYSPGWYEEGDPEDPYSSGMIAGTGRITSIVEGDLADRVRARSDKSGEVAIIEDHWDIGYCVTCSHEEVDFEVQVAGEKVFRTEFADSGGEIRGALAITGYAQFNAWLEAARDA
jgi:hypothetical protein